MSQHFISRDDAERDLLACAAYLAESIQSNDGRAQAMMAVVPKYLAKGEVDLAAELSNTVDDPFARDRLLTAVAETCAGIDDDEYALQLVEAMDDPGMRAQARERIGLRLASAGSIEKARSIADSMDHRDNVLAGIAIRQYADSNEKEALETVTDIGFVSAASHAFIAMAAADVEHEKYECAAAMLERAIEPAEEIEHEEERIRVLIDISNSFVAAKRKDRAIEMFDKAREYAEQLDNIHRDNFLAAVSVGFLRSGSLDLADRTLDAVADKTQIATALLGFAREFWRRDESDDAFESLGEAYSILRSQKEAETRDSRARFSLLANIAEQFAGFGKGERAIEVAQEIENEEQSMNALSQIARILAVQENDELARLALNSIPDDAHRVSALIALSDVASSKEDETKATALLEEASTLAEEVPQLASRSAAFNAIATRFVALNDKEKAHTVAAANLGLIATIKDESSQVSLLVDLAELFEKAEFTIAESESEVIKSLLVPKRL